MTSDDCIGLLDHFNINIAKPWHGFKFGFHNYYCVVDGYMPLDVAIDLYENNGEVGRKDIRAGGHCGCLHPSRQADWYDDEGRRLWTMADKEAISKLSDTIQRHLTLDPETEAFAEDRTKTGHGYVTTYHIDSVVGLLLTIQAIERLFQNNRTTKLLLPHMRN